MKPALSPSACSKAKEMLLLICTNMTLSRRMRKCSSRCAGNKIQTLCLLRFECPAIPCSGCLSWRQCDEQVFTTTNLKLLRQIAERVSIAIDNALAYREIQRLKERLVGWRTSRSPSSLNNVESEFGEIIGRSEAMNNVLKQVEMVAHSDSTVLILGETGTGKELIARAIHNLSGRNGRRMVKMNCAAMPAGLLESDLFGHERGAFTGASAPSVSAASELADKAPCSSIKWAICRWNCSPNCCASSGSRSSNVMSGEQQADSDRRSIDRRHQPRSQADGYRQGIPQRSLLPAQRVPDPPAAAARTSQTISRCWWEGRLPLKSPRRMGRNIDSIPAETLRTLTRMGGAVATCASWKTLSNGRYCSPARQRTAALPAGAGYRGSPRGRRRSCLRKVRMNIN